MITVIALRELHKKFSEVAGAVLRVWDYINNRERENTSNIVDKYAHTAITSSSKPRIKNKLCISRD
jgi:hypothetical protein